MTKYTKENIIESVKNFIIKYNRIPKKRELSTKYNLPSQYTLEKLFGMSCGEFMKEYFGETNRRFHSKESIINDVKKFKDIYGYYPEIKDFDGKNTLPDSKTIERHFNLTYSQFMYEYFSIVTQSPFNFEGLNHNDVINLFKREYEKNDGTSKRSYDQLKSRNTPSADAICKFLNLSWNKLKNLSGYEVIETNYTNEEILLMIRELSKVIARTPSVADVDDNLRVSTKTIRDRFGSYNEAIKQSKLELHKTPDVITESDEELLEIYIEFSNNIGREASAKDLNESEYIYNSDVFSQRFGGMNELKTAAGFYVRLQRKRYSKYELSKILLAIYKEKNRKPTNKEISENLNLPSISTITRYFHTTSMGNIWNELIGLENK